MRPLILAFLAMLLLPFASARAQGISGAAVEGRVAGPAGESIPNARVSLVDSSTGRYQRSTSGTTGRFTFENVPVGGPYTVEVRAIGFVPRAIPGIFVHLGDRVTRDVILSSLAYQLAAVTVRAGSEHDAGAGGPVHDIPGEAVRNLPLRKRDFVGLLAMAPQASGSSNLSINGQHTRLNAIQVDGGTASDFLGLNVTPGAGTGARALSIEALRELRILIAPFDVRQGGFTGGLINAVTRSGTNRHEQAAFVNFGGNRLVGPDTAGQGSDAFTTLQYGASAGGPIIRNRLHYFAVADLQAQATPATGLRIDHPSVSGSDSLAERVALVAQNQYGFDPGGSSAPILRQPNTTLFTKLSWQPASAHLLELTTNFSDARNDAIIRASLRDGWQLSGSGSATHVRNVTNRLKATSTIGGIANELIASVTTSNTDIASFLRVPVFLVGTIPGKLPLSLGSTRNAQGTQTDQRLIELTDNVTWNHGDHTVTTGVQSQLLHVYDNFFLGRWGAWTFANVDSFAKGVAQRYEVAVPLAARPEGPVADANPYQIAGYLQDRWHLAPRVTLTAGARIDVPFLGSPAQNPALLADAALGNIDTHQLPSGNAVFSPRVGAAVDLGSKRDWLVRGGAGGFAGHPPYIYVASAFANTGQEGALLTCTLANGVPAPTTDVDRLPTKCVNSGAPTAAKPTVTVFDPAFRFQQAIKYDIGVEHAVLGVRFAMDLIHSRTRNTPFVRDVNLVELGTSVEGRTMYGQLTPRTGGVTVTTARRDSVAFGPIYQYGNRSADRSTSVTLEAGKTWTDGLVQVGYTWSRSEDVMSLSGTTAVMTMITNPLDGTMTNRRLRRSARDIPHNFVATAVAPARFGVTVSGLFRLRSGTPYAYLATGDPNADGFANDLVYVPRDSLDVTLTRPADYGALDAFIMGEACLRNHRGSIIGRTTCRNPRVMSFDSRFAKRVRLRSLKSAEIGLDIFNVPNLLRRQWGLVRETSSGESVPLLSMAGYDGALNRPRYDLAAPARAHVLTDLSRWRLQLGARFEY